MAAVRGHLSSFGDAEIVLVMFAQQRILRGYRARFAAPLRVVTSEDRSAYRAYGLGEEPATADADHRDTRQLGGDFVVGPTGLIAYAYRSASADDRPDADDLVQAVGASRAAT